MAFDSLFIGVTGLSAYQQQIDVISNNIANVGTTGFKGQSVNFQDLLYQTQQFASAPTQTRGGVNSQDVGLGVKVGSIDTNLSQGGLQTTGINTNLAINGDGFFVLNDTGGSGTPKFTRNGDFSINENGVLYDPSSGLAVQGFTANKNGTITATGVPSSLQIPLGLKSQAVGTGQGAKSGPTGDLNFDISFGGNLDQTQYISAVSNAGVGAALTTISTTVYDSLGGAHLVNVTFTPKVSATGGAALPVQVQNAQGAQVTAATEWSYTMTSTDGTTFDLAALKGQSVLLFFQEGVGCQPCWDQIKDIEAHRDQFTALGVDKIVSITTQTPDVLKQKVELEKLSTPVLSDPNLDVSRAYQANQYGMMGTSTDGHSFVLVGKDGIIKWRADYGGAPKYTMQLPVQNLTADMKAGLKGATA